jgi:hypothetical protein
MVRYSFLVRLSHPLLHAGLSRRLSDHLSALASTLGGTVSPICFAAFKLITNSNSWVAPREGRPAWCPLEFCPHKQQRDVMRHHYQLHKT